VQCLRSMTSRHLPCRNHTAQHPSTVSTVRSSSLGTGVSRRSSSNEGASTSGRHHLTETVSHPVRRHRGVRCSVVAPGVEQETALSRDQQSLQPQPTTALLCDPETFTVEAGELSTVNHEASQRPEDVFRCSGCSLEDCQVYGDAEQLPCTACAMHQCPVGI